MAEFNFSLTDGNPDELAKLNKTLNWLMNNLDHDNITRIYTEYCDIQSELGETVIDGPLLKMTAGTTTLRLKMGKEGSDFVFKLFNVAGAETITLNSTGNISAYNMTAFDNITVKQASSTNVSITIGDGLGGVTPATITYSGQDVPVSDVQLEIKSVSNISLYGSTAGYIMLNSALTTVTKNLSVTGTLNLGGAIYSSSINANGNLGVTGTLNLGGALFSSSINSKGILGIDRIEGYTNADIVYLGSGNCRIDVAGGNLHLKDTNGAYLVIMSTSLVYYDSGGTPHTIY